MRIKFLSVIVSLLFVSFAISSCLDSEQVVAEYSTDATIRAFALDTVHGKKYAFSIDQSSAEGKIFNRNPLPVGSDTIINKILIDTLITNSGIVILLNAEGKDSIVNDVTQTLNTTDSVDLRKPIRVKVMSMEAVNLSYQGVPEDIYKKYMRYYTIQVNVHELDPDSLNWGQPKGEEPKPLATNFSGGAITGAQKTVVFNQKIVVFSKTAASQIIAYQADTNNPANWTSVGTITGLPATVLLSSIVSFNNALYATADESVYYSTDGIAWTTHPTLNDRKIATLLVALPKNTDHEWNKTMGIAAISIDIDGTLRYCLTNSDATVWKQAIGEGEIVSPEFPTTDITATSRVNRTGVQEAMLVGGQVNTLTQEEKHTTPWFTSTGDSWAELYTEEKFCPQLTLPSIFHYGKEFYLFGNAFDLFYTSKTGIAWTEAPKKFCFPEALTNRKESEYSMVVDSENYVWIILSKGATGGDDVWRFRLNKLNPDYASIP